MQDVLSRVNLSAFNLTGAARDFQSDVLGFFHAIDWSERWLLYLAAFHTVVLALTVSLRRSHNAQMVLLVGILGAVRCAESLNSYAGEHWQSFASQNYFDKRGVFISIMFSAPLLCVAMFVLLNALRLASQLLVQVKRKEFANAQRKKAKAKQQ